MSRTTVTNDTLRAAYADRTSAARSWRAAGGAVVGYLCDVVPDELIAAAGMLPYRISGDPELDDDLVDARIGVFRTPFSSRPQRVGFTTSILQSVLRGDLDFVDHLVVPHTRSAVQSIYRELELAREDENGTRIPDLYYLDKAYTDDEHTDAFDRGEVRAFTAAVESWAGSVITPSALAAAIVERNRLRRVLGRVSAARRADPPTVRGSDAVRAFALAGAMPAGDAADLISAWLDEADPLPGTTGPRVFLAGSPQDHPGVYELIESSGATVVADDHCWGDRCADGVLTAEVDPGADTLSNAVADRFHAAPACSVQFPLADAVVRFSARVRAARCDAVVFWVLEGDDLQLWETPDQITAVERLGLPVLHLPGRPYQGRPNAATLERVQEFLSGVAGRAS